MDLMIDQFCQSYPIAGSSVLISSLKATVIAFPRFCPQVGATGDTRSVKPTNTASPIHLCLIRSPPVRFPITTNPLTMVGRYPPHLIHNESSDPATGTPDPPAGCR